MYGREKRVLLREYLDHGWSKSALAQKLGISRRAIYHWINTGQLDRDLDGEALCYKSRPVVAFRENVEDSPALAAPAHLSAQGVVSPAAPSASLRARFAAPAQRAGTTSICWTVSRTGLISQSPR